MKPDALAYPKSGAHGASRPKWLDVLVLAKVRVNSLVVATTAGGYYMAARDGIDWGVLLLVSIGTALVASGAAAINQVDERDTDRLMNRTRSRPMADGRMSVAEGRTIAALFSAAGLLLLWLSSNTVATLVALATLVSYAMIYTPLKRRTSLSTIIGAVPGALPPLIGWAAVRGSVAGPQPWVLFVIMFVWQLPHFLAIAWIFRDDYARAGLKMLPVVEGADGRVTGRQTALWAATLLPLGLLPLVFGLADTTYAVGSLALGVAQFLLALQFARRRSLATARGLFYGSIVYLPLLWALMAIGKR
jgi:protoheme IX farnesyltransferase